MTPKPRTSRPMPPMPESRIQSGEPAAIFQVATEEQLSPELAELRPGYLYAPALLMAEKFERVMPFLTNETVPVAVLPRVITDDEAEVVYRALEKLAQNGVKEALVGTIGHVALAKQAGMSVRADFGMNAFNSHTLDVLRSAGFLSATASFELRLSQIRDL